MIKAYYYLAKPGIVRGNIFTAMGGFFLASRGYINLPLLLAAFFGTAFVIASACVFNNYLDRKVDSKMKRTQKRALVTGEISSLNAIIFGIVLLFLGMIALLFTSTAALVSAIIGFVFYVAVYGYAKRKSIHGTLIGSISGAMPPVIGYTAVTSSFDLGALLLFFVLVAWQMPHFYAIGIFRKSDYENANIPVLPVVKGIEATYRQMVFYSLLFLAATSLLTLLGYTSYIYLLIMLTTGGYWVFKILNRRANIDQWAKQVFGISILVLAVFSVAISIDFALPF